MKLKIKYFIKICIYWGLHILYVFPVRKKLVYLVSFSGKHVCCNPKYIYEYMQKQNLPYVYVWCSENRDGIAAKNVIFVKPHSFKSIFYALVAGVYIANDQIPDYLPFRKSQMIIETWHGGGIYKKDGYKDSATFKYSVSSYLGQRKRQYLHYFISSSKLFTKYGIEDFSLNEEKFAPYGMPRNDIFFDKQRIVSARNKVRSLFEIEDNKTIILYAPTFRGDARFAEFDFTLDTVSISEAVKKRFSKDAVFFMRGHHTFEMADISMEKEDSINVSDYPDMQELICAADILITDYSSTLWDWSFTLKPAFLFVPDMEKYIAERGTYMPIEEWGFPYAKTNEQLSDIIQIFDETQFIKDMHKHHNDLGSFDCGTSAKTIVEDIKRYSK